VWSFECRIPPYDLRGTAERWRRCSEPSPLGLQTPRRILSLRGTRTQYSKDNEDEFHGACSSNVQQQCRIRHPR